MQLNSLVRYLASPARINGNLLEAQLRHVFIGEICDIHRTWQDDTVLARAVVLGFNGEMTRLSLIGSCTGLSRDVVISPTGKALSINLSDSLAGSVLSPEGKVTTRLTPALTEAPAESRSVQASPMAWHQRRSIDTPLYTGVRAVDGLMTCGRGQRIGIFAAAGCGKTTLMQMIIRNADADIFVIGLIGERGREVAEFIEEIRESEQAGRCVIVYATSDYSPLDRANAASVAMTVAEFYRDKGLNVVLFLDSVTRYARALRDVALVAGEAPARRGYPASVFEKLPQLLERPGNALRGSITAFFTILTEGEDDTDPIAEEIRSILDGHILLSSKLAAKNHFPAIDVLNSLSRVTARICTPEHLRAAGAFREQLAKIDSLQMLADFGEYKPGVNPENDHLFGKSEKFRQFLTQPVNEAENPKRLLERLHALIQ